MGVGLSSMKCYLLLSLPVLCRNKDFESGNGRQYVTRLFVSLSILSRHDFKKDPRSFALY